VLSGKASLLHTSGFLIKNHGRAEFRSRWVWFERACIFIGIQFTKHFIEFVFVETNQFVGSNPNVILMRKTSARAWLLEANAGLDQFKLIYLKV